MYLPPSNLTNSRSPWASATRKPLGRKSRRALIIPRLNKASPAIRSLPKTTHLKSNQIAAKSLRRTILLSKSLLQLKICLVPVRSILYRRMTSRTSRKLWRLISLPYLTRAARTSESWSRGKSPRRVRTRAPSSHSTIPCPTSSPNSFNLKVMKKNMKRWFTRSTSRAS